jgi:hypothetical protein
MIKKLNIQWNGKTFCNQMTKGNVYFDCAIQRSYVWDDYRKSLYIHSLMQDYPVPAFYFERDKDNKYVALDGKQRGTTLLNFKNDEFALIDNLELSYDEDGNEFDLSGLKFSELPEWAQDAINNFSFTIYYFEGLSEEERDSIFFRLNNGKPLTAVELTRVKAKALSKFQEIARHDLIDIAVTDKGKTKYNHENLVMQVWANCFIEDVSFETKTFRNIIENADVADNQVTAIKGCFDLILEMYNKLDSKNKEQKKIAKRIVTRTHLVGLVKVLLTAVQNDYDLDKFESWMREFFAGTKRASVNEDYNDACGSGSARKEKVNFRMNILEESMRNAINDVSEVSQ